MKNIKQPRTQVDTKNLGPMTRAKPTRGKPNQILLLLEIKRSAEIQNLIRERSSSKSEEDL